MTAADKTYLRFSKAIISTTENQISTTELLDRLAQLQDELSTTVQETIDLQSLDKYRTDLINRKLLRHRDNGVRAFVACCISDILRLYAPDAPYTDVQLTDFLKLVLGQFTQMGDPENGYYAQQKYLIARLLEFRSIVLIADLPTSNKLIEELFAIFYDDAYQFEPKMYNMMGGILGEVISEIDSVPMPVLKLIFNKFLTYNPADIPKGLPLVSNCGYELSLILCKTYANRMSRHLTRYYSEILYHVTNGKDGQQLSYESNINMAKTVAKLHKLVIRLWESVPEMISSVIGFVYHELSSQDETVRKMTTKLVGQLLTVSSTVNFVTSHEDIFKAWLSKIADVSAEVRIEWIQSIPGIITKRDDISDSIGKGLAKTFIDADYRVRKLSVTVFEEVPVNVIWNSIKEKSVYTSLLHLTREKNRDVRELCIKTTADFYGHSIEHISRTSDNADIWEVVDDIPNTLFNLYYINDFNINEQVDNMIFESLLPLEVDDNKRVSRLLEVISHFDKKAYASFFAFNKRQLQMSLAFNKYVDFCKILNKNDSQTDQVTDSELPSAEEPQVNITDVTIKYHKTIEWLASSMAEPQKVSESLEILKQMNDSRIFFLIKTCIATEVPIITLKNSFKELFNKLRDPGLFRRYNIPTISTIMPKDLAAFIKVLLYRSAPLIYNVSNVAIFLDLSNKHNAEQIEIKRTLLDEVSRVNPSLFKDQIRTLTNNVKELDVSDDRDDNDTSTLNETLKTLYKISKALQDQVDFDSFFLSKLHDFALEGNPIMAKYATKLICLAPSAETEVERLRSYILPLDKEKDKHFTSHIVVLMEIMKYFPRILNEASTDIVSYLIKEVLLSNVVTGPIDDEPEWIDEVELLDSSRETYRPLAAKLYVLKLFTNKLRSIADTVEKDNLSKGFAEKTIKLFFYLIASGGELVPETNTDNYPTPDSYQKRLRLSAGLQILKLAKLSSMSNYIKSTDVIKLINLVEDESLSVRKIFLDTLGDYIGNELISIKFIPLVFFTAYEPDKELKSTTKTWINYTFNKESFKKGTFFERVLPRLIHAIAHHPDIVDGLDAKGEDDNEYTNALTTAVDYLVFYFDSIAAQDNFNLLYYLSERVKNYQDTLVGEDGEEDEETSTQSSDKLYLISELSQLILLQLKERRNWQHSPYPGKLNLPGDLFKPFRSTEDAQASFKTYIDEKYVESLKANIKMKVNKIVHKSQTQRQKAQKRMLASEYNQDSEIRGKSKRRRLKERHNGDDENGDDDDEDEVVGRSRADVRKSGRSRRAVNYRVDSDSE
ncbi:Pds5 protein [Maudiozyma humilis]|uniref:Pds5 protein n=1 Tax=Maudiozyma humilis TaxID=51915 RepID=A0AAV5S302_MAUHU|nr:Pds5 protein [Kazachstania humilis]